MRSNQRTVTPTRSAAAEKARRAPREIIYPESDGKPMAESSLHLEEMVRCLLILQDWFADDPTVAVAGNQLLYPERGNPRKSVAPDVYVAKGVPKDAPLATYLVWELGVPPAVVLEVTSKSTRMEDQRKKRTIYAEIGVGEYLLYDPRVEWLQPPLQGYRLGASGYEPLAEAAEGGLLSEELGLRLELEDGRLQFYDRRSGRRLLSPVERAALEAERAGAEAEARRAAEARIAELEALLRDRRPPSP